MMFLILCFFLFPSVCGGCLCSGGSSGTGGVDCLWEDEETPAPHHYRRLRRLPSTGHVAWADLGFSLGC